MRQNFQENGGILLEILQLVQGGVRPFEVAPRYDLLPAEPFKTSEALENWDARIATIPEIKDQLISKMREFRGEAADKCLRKILKKILDPEVIRVYTWTGQKTEDRSRSIEKKNFTTIIIGNGSKFEGKGFSQNKINFQLTFSFLPVLDQMLAMYQTQEGPVSRPWVQKVFQDFLRRNNQKRN